MTEQVLREAIRRVARAEPDPPTAFELDALAEAPRSEMVLALLRAAG